MTDTLEEPLPTPLFQFVGESFVLRYYRILFGMPSLAHLFYQDVSRLCRLDDNGKMSITTTMEAIKEKILSLNYDHYRARILSVDVQESRTGGVNVCVTGYMFGTNKMARNFEQIFLLAPKEGGYFILYDMFRFVDELPNVEIVVDAKEVPVVKAVDEIPNVERVVDANEVSLVKVDDVPNVETVVDTEKDPIVEVVDGVHDNSCVVGTEEISLVKVIHEVCDYSCVVDAKDVSLVEMRDDSCVVDTKEVPLAKVFGEVFDDSCVVDTNEVPFAKVFDDSCLVDAKEIPRAKVVYEVLDDSCVVDTKEIPLSRVVYEVHDDYCVVDAKEILLPKVVNDVPVDVEEVPLAEVVNTDIGGAWMPSSSAIRCCVKSRNEGSPAGIILKSQNQNELYMLDKVPHVAFEVVDELARDISCVVDPKEVPFGNVVDEIRDHFCVVDTKEVSLTKVVDQVHDSRVVEPNEVSLAKVIYEVLDHSCMVKSESKIEEAPKKSQASIENGATFSSYAPPLSGIEPKIQEHRVRHLQSSILGGEVVPISVEKVDDYSIYIKCLPLSVTPSLLEEEFKRFGAIKSGGIQVNRNKQGFCFGFVEFEEAKSVEKALQASPVRIDGCQIAVEEKHSSTYRGGRWAHMHEGVKVGGDHCDFRRRGRGSVRWEGLLQ